MAPLAIRIAVPGDLPEILAIHNDVIANTTAIYSEEPATLRSREIWLEEKRAAGLPVIVAESEDRVLGFATFGRFRAWPCYRHTVEHSVHVRADQRGRGIGRALLDAIVRHADEQGHHVIVAAIDAENAASLSLHGTLGFTRSGTLLQVGRKFGRWLDLVFMQRLLGA